MTVEVYNLREGVCSSAYHQPQYRLAMLEDQARTIIHSLAIKPSALPSDPAMPNPAEASIAYLSDAPLCITRHLLASHDEVE